LMLRRSPRRGGFWQGVTGAPLDGETDEAAAIREVREETGWDVTATLESLGVNYSYALARSSAARLEKIYGPNVGEISVVSFAAETPDDLEPVLDPDEHDAFGWFGLEEARALLEWPIEHDALRHRRAALQAALVRATTGTTRREDTQRLG
jgi:lipoyl(octanoyl) transferase